MPPPVEQRRIFKARLSRKIAPYSDYSPPAHQSIRAVETEAECEANSIEPREPPPSLSNFAKNLENHLKLEES